MGNRKLLYFLKNEKKSLNDMKLKEVVIVVKNFRLTVQLFKSVRTSGKSMFYFLKTKIHFKLTFCN